MLINIIKFIHLLGVIGLFGSAIVCFTLLISKKSTTANINPHITTLNRTMLYLCTLTILTGTQLIYPKHFTFHTPWIQAAYILVIICTFIILPFQIIKKKIPRIIWIISYFILIMILVGVIHDAVTKTTFLF